MQELSAFKILFSFLRFSVTQFHRSCIWQTMLLFLLWILYWNVTGKFKEELKRAVTLGQCLKLSTPSLSSDQELVQAHGEKEHYIGGGTSIWKFCCPITFVAWEVLRIVPHICCQIEVLLLKWSLLSLCHLLRDAVPVTEVTWWLLSHPLTIILCRGICCHESKQIKILAVKCMDSGAAPQSILQGQTFPRKGQGRS